MLCLSFRRRQCGQYKANGTVQKEYMVHSRLDTSSKNLVAQVPFPSHSEPFLLLRWKADALQSGLSYLESKWAVYKL